MNSIDRAYTHCWEVRAWMVVTACRNIHEHPRASARSWASAVRPHRCNCVDLLPSGNWQRAALTSTGTVPCCSSTSSHWVCVRQSQEAREERQIAFGSESPTGVLSYLWRGSYGRSGRNVRKLKMISCHSIRIVPRQTMQQRRTAHASRHGDGVVGVRACVTPSVGEVLKIRYLHPSSRRRPRL